VADPDDEWGYALPGLTDRQFTLDITRLFEPTPFADLTTVAGARTDSAFAATATR
jgi:hypothetical protein